jgi:hypothetical protein
MAGLLYCPPMRDEFPESLPSSPEEEARREVEYEAAVNDALDGTMRAEELQQLRDVLRRRQSVLQRDFDVSDDPEERAHLRQLLSELEEQITVLDEEAGINRFVQDTIKFSQEVHRLSEG